MTKKAFDFNELSDKKIEGIKNSPTYNKPKEIGHKGVSTDKTINIFGLEFNQDVLVGIVKMLPIGLKLTIVYASLSVMLTTVFLIYLLISNLGVVYGLISIASLLLLIFAVSKIKKIIKLKQNKKNNGKRDSKKR